MEPNRAALMRLVAPISLQAAKVANLVILKSLPVANGVGKQFCVGVFNGDYATLFREDTQDVAGINQIRFAFFDCTFDEFNASNRTKEPHIIATIPFDYLTERPSNYYVYSIGFNYEKFHADNEGSPLCGRYIGITKRNPFSRLKEHWRDAALGKGHLLHKAWFTLMRRQQLEVVSFVICGTAKTLDEAYAIEETLVDEHTLAPKGLNAIPGGMKGIKMMHELRLLGATRQVNIEDRDRALVRLEGPHDRNSPCTHYRTGHFRNLSNGKLTWVSPCWVNQVSTAA